MDQLLQKECMDIIFLLGLICTSPVLISEKREEDEDAVKSEETKDFGYFRKINDIQR